MLEDSPAISKPQNWSVKHKNFFVSFFPPFLGGRRGREAFLWSKSIRAEGEKYDKVIRNFYNQVSVRHVFAEPVLHTETATPANK